MADKALHDLTSFLFLRSISSSKLYSWTPASYLLPQALSSLPFYKNALSLVLYMAISITSFSLSASFHLPRELCLTFITKVSTSSVTLCHVALFISLVTLYFYLYLFIVCLLPLKQNNFEGRKLVNFVYLYLPVCKQFLEHRRLLIDIG